MSATLDLPDARWEFVQLSGTWARENHVIATSLRPGRQSVGSDRGSSSHQHNPFLALQRTTTTEDTGEVYGFSLVYSGNFLAEAEVDAYDTTRVRIGISPNTFSWTLEPGAASRRPRRSSSTPSTGLGTMSDALHSLYRERLARGTWRDKPRPVLINNWEATYFGFDESKLIEIATSARDLGVELFVLDDGWFGVRDSDDSSLGDWFVDRRKLPNGLDGLAAKVEALGIKFGLWIEPEMISERSRLFEEHPDWAIGIPGRPRTESRQQFVLDMSRPEIVDHLFGVLSDVLASAPISYIKWDYNRTITEPYSTALPPDRQGEFFHRFVLGTYDLYARLTAAFPDVLFESCAGGGGRFDPGMLAFAPQAWTSDDTDAVERLAIQWGTSMAYPLSSMAAHVAAVPNHQTGRITPDRHPRRRGVLRGLRLRAGPDHVECRGPGVGRRPDRVLQGAPRASSSAAGSSACAARSRRASGPPGWPSTRTGARGRRLLPGPQPPGPRPPTGCACAASTPRAATGSPAGRTSRIRSSATTSGSGAATS